MFKKIFKKQNKTYKKNKNGRITTDVADANRSRSASGVWSAANSSMPSCIIAENSTLM